VYLGHIAVGLAAKPVAPKASLGALLVSTVAIDVLSGVFMVTGIETGAAGGHHSVHWSHGLFMAVVWAITGTAIAFLLSRDRRTAIVIGLLVFSHWVLDFISHPMGLGRDLWPDVPLLFEGSPKVGLGLYKSVPAALITEFVLIVAGVAVYLGSTRARDRTGTWAFWLLILSLFLLGFLALAAELTILPDLTFVLLLPFGIWVDRHRYLVTGTTK
jgi:hypothetical protein